MTKRGPEGGEVGQVPVNRQVDVGGRLGEPVYSLGRDDPVTENVEVDER